MSSEPIIQVTNLTKRFGSATALDNVSLTINSGEMVALIGASGSGKSTLLRILAGFIKADAGGGGVRINQQIVQSNGRLSPDVRHVRADIGFVFQQFNLVGRLSVMTNVLVGALAATPAWRAFFGWFTRESRLAALRALAQVGIIEHAHKRANDLSGGQQQRVAIARAMVQGAKVILADEPIASLDPESARNVMEILALVNREQGRAVVVSLHQVGYARRYCPRTIALRRGVVVYDGPSKALTAAMLCELYGGDAAELGIENDLARTEPALAPVLTPAMFQTQSRQTEAMHALTASL